MAEKQKPFQIEFPRTGDSSIGYISISDFSKTIPFEVKRTFWTYYTPESIVRGRHAHFKTEQVLIAVAGKIIVSLDQKGEISSFVLDQPYQGIYIPASCWHTMQYSHNAVQLVFASTQYEEKDYIRDYNEFRRIYG